MEQDSEDALDVSETRTDDDRTASEVPGPSRPAVEYHTSGDPSDFRPPDQKSILIHKLYVEKKFRECKSLIEDIVAKEDERLCEHAMLIRAQIAREGGQLRDSLVWLNRAHSSSPKSSRVLYELGRGYFLLGEHRKSLDYFQRAAELDPNNWRSFFWQSLAHYHLDTNGTSGALDKAQETLIACPKMGRSVEILTFVAKISMQRNDMVSAAEAYRRALEIEPENVHVITNLGLLYLKTNSEDKAFACLGKALTFDPAYVPAILAASTVLQNHGDYDVALSKYRVAADKCDYNGSLWNNIGMCFLGKGKLVAAISCLRKANYLCPLDWKILYNLGICYQAMLQFASAYHFMTAALNINPRNSIILMTLAIILSDLDDHDNARKAYSRGVELDPHNFIIRLNFAIFEYRRGRVAEANKWMEGVSIPPANGESAQFMEIEMLANRLRACLQAGSDEAAIIS